MKIWLPGCRRYICGIKNGKSEKRVLPRPSKKNYGQPGSEPSVSYGILPCRLKNCIRSMGGACTGFGGGLIIGVPPEGANEIVIKDMLELSNKDIINKYNSSCD